MSHRPRLAVIAATDAERGEARRVAQTLGVRPLEHGETADLYVWVGPNGLELRDDLETRGHRVDFRNIDRSPRARSTKQPIARALGHVPRTVVDVTAGFGTDAMRMAIIGYEVIAVERVAAARLLLEDGLRRTAGDLKHPIRTIAGDARDMLATLPHSPETIYLDPMYPAKRKESALARKPVRLLRQLAGDDEDAAELLATASRHALERVVVKRPHYAPPLTAEGVRAAWSITSKLVRYDVYRATGG